MDSLDPRSWRRTARQIVENNPDCLILPFWNAALAPALIGICKHVRRLAVNPPRIIGLMHNASSHDARGWDRWLTSRLLQHFDAAWTLSEEVTERIREQHAELPISTLFHPLYDQYPPAPEMTIARRALHLPPPSEADVILFFGLIRPYKGLDIAIDAISQLVNSPRPIHLCIAGESYEDWRPYAQRIATSPAADRIQVHERFIPDAEVGMFFGACNAVCLPYLKASQSGVTAIALHYGIPVIASDVGGLAEYFSNPALGHLSPPGDAQALAKAILKKLQDAPPSAADYSTAKAQFSWERFVQVALAN